MSYSFLPPAAFELLASCNDGVFITVDQPTPGTSVVRVGYRGFKDGMPAPGEIGAVEFDHDALDCTGDVKAGTLLYTLPRQSTCTHKKDTAGLYKGSTFRVVLDDRVTDRAVILGGVEEIPIPWKLSWVKNSKGAIVGFRCLTPASLGDKILTEKSLVFGCAEGNCQSEAISTGVCIARLGRAVRVGHDTNSMVRDDWSFKKPIQPTALTCLRNKEEKTLLGNQVNFAKWGTNALAGYCAFYW